MERFICTGVALLLTLGPSSSALGDVIVSPVGDSLAEGNSNNSYPFNLGFFGAGYQQVYNATEFSSLSGPELITQIAFRPDGTFGNAFSSTLPFVQIHLSTTEHVADALSATFANNVGADDMVVFSGALALSSANTGGGPKDFDIVVNLKTPFLYDPSRGSLLLEVRNFGGGSTTLFDSDSSNPDGTSRLYARGGPNVTGSTDTNGLVTRFTFEQQQRGVPEPSAFALLGAVALVGWGLRRRLL